MGHFHKFWKFYTRHSFFNELFIKKNLSYMAPKSEFTFALPFLGKLSFDLRTRLRRAIERDFPYCKLNVIERNTLFRFKDSLEEKNRFGIIYRYAYSNYKVTYYRKTFLPFYTRAAENTEISNLTGKSLRIVKQSTISDHLL